MVVPAKAAVLQKLEDSHRDASHAFGALQQRARVMEERATAAEERLTWAASARSDHPGGENDNRADAERLQQVLQENERLHAQLARDRVQLTDADRSTSQLKRRITELEIQIERASRNEAARKAQRQQDEQQIKSLRASIRALEKELINGASGYR